jgi:plastocyanin
MKIVKIDIPIKLPLVLFAIIAVTVGGISLLLFSLTLGIDGGGSAQLAYGVSSDSVFGDVPTNTDSDGSDSNDLLQDESKNDNSNDKKSISSNSGSNIAPQAKIEYTSSNEDEANSTANTPSASSLSGTSDVSIAGVNQDNSFDPNPIQISAGESVTWTNNDNEIHDVTSGNDGEEGMGQEFASSTLSSGKSFSHKFDKAGTYPYFCSFHESMTGQVIVK